jgi:hypothetical protein
LENSSDTAVDFWRVYTLVEVTSENSINNAIGPVAAVVETSRDTVRGGETRQGTALRAKKYNPRRNSSRTFFGCGVL